MKTLEETNCPHCNEPRPEDWEPEVQRENRCHTYIQTSIGIKLTKSAGMHLTSFFFQKLEILTKCRVEFKWLGNLLSQFVKEFPCGQKRPLKKQ